MECTKVWRSERIGKNVGIRRVRDTKPGIMGVKGREKYDREKEREKERNTEILR